MRASGIQTARVPLSNELVGEMLWQTQHSTSPLPPLSSSALSVFGCFVLLTCLTLTCWLTLASFYYSNIIHSSFIPCFLLCSLRQTGAVTQFPHSNRVCVCSGAHWFLLNKVWGSASSARKKKKLVFVVVCARHWRFSVGAVWIIKEVRTEPEAGQSTAAA